MTIPPRPIWIAAVWFVMATAPIAAQEEEARLAAERMEALEMEPTWVSPLWVSPLPGPSDLEETPTRHAFVTMGEGALFLVHMPMLDGHKEHMYQLVLEASLPEEDWRILRDAYRLARPDTTPFLVNRDDDLFRLADLITGKRTSFEAEVYPYPDVDSTRRPPWTPSMTPLIQQTTVTVDRVVYWRHVDLDFRRPRHQTYVLFGAGDEAFLHHYMIASPDYDQVIALKEPPEWLPQKLLELSAHVNVSDLPADLPSPTCRDPLAAGPHDVQYYGIQEFHGKPLPKYELSVDRNLWFNTSISNGINPCP